jgi:glycerol-3-phosphate acyltransferase PlsY
LGVFLTIVPWAVLAAFVVFALVFWRTRYVSLGSVAAAIVVPLWTLIQHTMISPVADFVPTVAALCAASAIIIAKHHENIGRLMAGQENRFGVAK